MEQRSELAMVLSLKLMEDGHTSVYAFPRKITSDGALSSCVGDMDVNGWYIDGLEVSAWYSKTYPNLNFGSMYQSIRYMDVYLLGLEEAQASVRTLERLYKAVRNTEAKMDFAPMSFGDYVMIMAKTMKIKRFLVHALRRSKNEEGHYLELTKQQAITWLNAKGLETPGDLKISDLK